MFGEQIGEADAFAQMDYAVEAGINFFDTAEIYTIPPKPETQGESERFVGKWLKERGQRDKIYIATKVAGRSSFLKWLREGEELPRLTYDQMRAAVDGSLERLQIECIDLYQTHWPDRRLRIFGEQARGYRHYPDDYEAFEEITDGMRRLQAAGKIKSFGVSNETPWGVMKHLQATPGDDTLRIASIQNAYNLLNREFESGLAEIAMNESVGLLAYSPLAQGALTGKYLDGARPAGARGTLFGRLGRYETPAADAAIKAYVALAKEFDVDVAQMALQFVTTRPWVTSNIIGASTLEQLKVDIDSVNMNWPDDLETRINELHMQFPNPCP